jgi:hypothetical protein
LGDLVFVGSWAIVFWVSGWAIVFLVGGWAIAFFWGEWAITCLVIFCRSNSNKFPYDAQP